jgi:hypothetical protein
MIYHDGGTMTGMGGLSHIMTTLEKLTRGHGQEAPDRPRSVFLFENGIGRGD